jgi:hypothetical protein
MMDLQFLNARRHRLRSGNDVADQPLACVGGHQAEEIAGLPVRIGGVMRTAPAIHTSVGEFAFRIPHGF